MHNCSIPIFILWIQIDKRFFVWSPMFLTCFRNDIGWISKTGIFLVISIAIHLWRYLLSGSIINWTDLLSLPKDGTWLVIVDSSCWWWFVGVSDYYGCGWWRNVRDRCYLLLWFFVVLVTLNVDKYIFRDLLFLLSYFGFIARTLDLLDFVFLLIQFGRRTDIINIAGWILLNKRVEKLITFMLNNIDLTTISINIIANNNIILSFIGLSPSKLVVGIHHIFATCLFYYYPISPIIIFTCIVSCHEIGLVCVYIGLVCVNVVAWIPIDFVYISQQFLIHTFLILQKLVDIVTSIGGHHHPWPHQISTGP